MLRVQKITKEYGNEVVLNDISFSLGPDQKKALIGLNGVGKSTLLKIITGLEYPDQGTIDVGDKSIVYLPQEMVIMVIKDEHESIAAYLNEIVGLYEIKQQMDTLEKNLTDPKKIESYGELQDEYSNLGGYDFAARLKRLLSGFGLKDYTDISMNSLSGGQKVKVYFTGLLLKNPDILLLDEPTNNLDLSSIIWLEEFIRQSQSAFIIISHDRRFLDNIVSSVIEINWQTRTTTEESGNYSDFRKRQEKKHERQYQEYIQAQEKIKDLQTAARLKKQWAAKGANQTPKDKDKYLRGYRRDRSAKMGGSAKVIEKQIERTTNKAEKPFERKPLKISLEAEASPAKHSISLSDVRAGYKDGFSLKPLNLEISYGQKVAILGDNGVGKSTLLRTIIGEQQSLAGEVKLGSSLSIGNLTQGHENLSMNQTVLSYFETRAELTGVEARRILNNFRIEAKDVFKKVSQLSPGERAKLILATFAARRVNVLILDEPTNHLDFESMEALEEVLHNYTGTVITVSHDRYFLEQVEFDSIYELTDGYLSSVVNLEDYYQQKGAQK